MPREIAVDPVPLAVHTGFPWPVTPLPLAELASLGVLPVAGDGAGGRGARGRLARPPIATIPLRCLRGIAHGPPRFADLHRPRGATKPCKARGRACRPRSSSTRATPTASNCTGWKRCRMIRWTLPPGPARLSHHRRGAVCQAAGCSLPSRELSVADCGETTVPLPGTSRGGTATALNELRRRSVDQGLHGVQAARRVSGSHEGRLDCGCEAGQGMCAFQPPTDPRPRRGQLSAAWGKLALRGRRSAAVGNHRSCAVKLHALPR